MTLRQVDFGRPIGQPRLGMALLTLGLGSLAVSLWLRYEWRRLDDAQASIALAQLASRTAAAAAPRPPVSPTARRLAQARLEAGLPWSRALSAVEAASKDPIYLLTLSIDPASGLISIAAEAPSLQDALQFSKALEASRDLVRPLISSHEHGIDPSSGRQRVFFKLTARWATP